MNINTKPQKRSLFRPRHVTLGALLFVFVVLAVYKTQFGVNAQGGGSGGLPYQAFLWVKNGLAVQYPGKDILYDSLFGSAFLFSPSDPSFQNNWHRITVVPNAHKDSSPAGYSFDAGPSGQISPSEFQNAALVADSHINFPLVSGAPIKNDHYYRVKFNFRAGPNGGNAGNEAQKKWDTDGGFQNRGLFAVTLLTDGNVTNGNGAQEFIARPDFGVVPDDYRGNPLLSAVTAEGSTHNTHGNSRCFQTIGDPNPQNSWCTWQSGTWKMRSNQLDSNGVPLPIQSEDNQQLMIRSGSTLDESWFVGELQLDNIELYETDSSGNPLGGSPQNLLLNASKNATFEDAAGPSDVNTSVSQQPASDYFEFSRKTEQPSGGLPQNGYLSYFSKNYYVVSANPNDPQSYPLFTQYPNRQCAKDANGVQRFFQRIDPDVPCYPSASQLNRLAEGTAVYDEKISGQYTASSIYVKTKVVNNICVDASIPKANNEATVHMVTQLTNYQDTDNNGFFSGFGAGKDSEIPQLAPAPSGGNQSVLTNQDNTIVECADPSFVIRSQTPTTAQCFVNSLYTASPDVRLDLGNPGSFTQFRVQLGTGAFGPWQTFTSTNQCNATTYSFSKNLFSDIGITSHEQGVKTVGVQFGTHVGNTDVEGPVLFDDIIYGYPWLSTFRGDVHSNGAVNGEASSLGLSALAQYSRFTCNPPPGRSNADYVVSAVGGFQVITPSESNCADNGSASPFQTGLSTQLDQTPGALSGTLQGSDASGLEGAIGSIDIAALQAQATVICSSGTIISDFNALPGSCQATQNSNRAGNLIFVTGDVTISGGASAVVVNNGATVDVSGAWTVATTGTIFVNSNVEYQNSSQAINSTRQLASLALLAGNNINIATPVTHLAGVYFSQATITTSQDPSAPKLSLYGSLIANFIDFNRNWLGI